MNMLEEIRRLTPPELVLDWKILTLSTIIYERRIVPLIEVEEIRQGIIKDVFK